MGEPSNTQRGMPAQGIDDSSKKSNKPTDQSFDFAPIPGQEPEEPAEEPPPILAKYIRSTICYGQPEVWGVARFKNWVLGDEAYDEEVLEITLKYAQYGGNWQRKLLGSKAKDARARHIESADIPGEMATETTCDGIIWRAERDLKNGDKSQREQQVDRVAERMLAAMKVRKTINDFAKLDRFDVPSNK